MTWRRALIEQLAACTPGGYAPGEPPATEPTAWAAMALTASGEIATARTACDWLVRCQARDGSVGVRLKEATPAWPTSLAMLAWRRIDEATGESRYLANIQRAIKWALATRGRTVERKPEIGHDTTLVGWSWAADTHSWLEPSAMFVKALTAVGEAEHPRTREAVRLLVDRLLPTGGANYGNTRVLDQYVLPHVQPTGLVMWALADCDVTDPRIDASLAYLTECLEEPLGTASLAYAVLGLAAHQQLPSRAAALLAQSFAQQSAKASPYKLALLGMAATTAAHQLTS